MDHLDDELNALMSRPSESAVRAILDQFIDTPERRDAARLLLRYGNPPPGSALRRIGHLRGDKNCREIRAGMLLALQAAMLMAGLQAVIAAFEGRVARGELDRAKVALLAGEIQRFWRDLQPFRPLVNGMVKLLAKGSLVGLAHREMLHDLDDRVFQVEVAMARLGL